MPQETDRLKLPLPLGNETVTRESINGIFEKIDAGVATKADLDALREAVSKMDIPDASLTQKGKVQLSSKTDGTSETVAATEKAVRDARAEAETSAKKYSDTNFRKPTQINRANLVKNGSALMAFDYWVTIAGNWAIYSNPTVGYFWSQDGAISAGQYAVLDSNTISVYPGTHTLQAMFHTVGSGANGLVLIEIKNASTDVTINSLSADRNTWWHRKGMSFNVPEGVSAIKLRLVVSNYPGGSNMGFSRISLNEGISELPYSQEGDIRALYEQNQVVKQSGVDAKNGIVGAINAKGGNASTNDTWAQLTAKINAINTGKKFATGSFVITNNGTGSVSGLAFTPRNVIFSSIQSNMSPTESQYFGVYSADAMRYNLSSSKLVPLNRVEGINTYLSADGAITIDASGFSVNAGGIREARWYSYFATD